MERNSRSGRRTGLRLILVGLCKTGERKREVKTSIRSDKRKWMDDIAKEAEDTAGNQHMRTLYRLTKTLCNERPRRSVAVTWIRMGMS